MELGSYTYPITERALGIVMQVKLKAYFLSLNPEASALRQWDAGFILDFLKGNMWQPAGWQDFEIKEVTRLPKEERAIVIIPARHHKSLEEQVNQELQSIDNVVFFCLGDEEAEFDIEKIEHQSIYTWIQNPHIGKHDNYNKLGTGYPQHIKEFLPKEIHKKLNLYFAGQITHKRRIELIDVLLEYEAHWRNCRVIKTNGFTQGEAPKDYYKYMCEAMAAPAPSGAIIPDSFRLFEALECMSIPIADTVTPKGEIMPYWDWLFGEASPFPQVTQWDSLYAIMLEIRENWPMNVHKQTAWWIKYKREFANKVWRQLNA
jgi:hypothetical protein